MKYLSLTNSPGLLSGYLFPQGGDTSIDARAPNGAPTVMEGISMIRCALAAALFAVLWIFTPPAEPHIRWCGFYWLTGHPCALCGLTRAMFALAKGHFAEAEHFNALAPLGFAMVFSLFWSGKITGRLWTAGMAAFAAYGLWRIL